MASIVDSIRSVYTDSFSTLKLGAFSAAIYFLFTLYVPSNYSNPLNAALIIFIISLYLGFCSIIASNRINQRIEVLPSLNIINFFKTALQVTIIFLPFAFVSSVCVNFVVGLFRFEGLPQIIALWLVRFVVFSAFISSLINFSEKNNISDGLNFSKMTGALADVIVYTILGLILLAICSVFIAMPILYLLYQFFKFGPIFQYVAVFFITLNLAYMADFWGQLHYDIQSRDNYY